MLASVALICLYALVTISRAGGKSRGHDVAADVSCMCGRSLARVAPWGAMGAE